VFLPKQKAEFTEPMECAMVSCLPEGSDRVYEVKLDGYRAIGVKSSRNDPYSRNHKNFNKRFPQIAEALGDLPATQKLLFDAFLVCVCSRVDRAVSEKPAIILFPVSSTEKVLVWQI